jgi:glutamate racemase
MKIGFFDSGLGGLLLLKAVAKELPLYDYEFYGDTAHLPYGDRTEEEIYTLTKAGVEHLFQRDCLLVIVACNTASAETLRRLQDTILIGNYAGRRILGVIIPTVEVVAASPHSTVALFATKRTVESGKYERELTKLGAKTILMSKSLPGLVPLIEAGKHEEAAEHIVAETKSMKDAGAEAIILGCTHYCLLKDEVRAALGGEGTVFSQDELIPDRLRDYLARHTETETKLTRHATRNIFLTAHKPEYDEIIRHLMGGVIMTD